MSKKMVEGFRLSPQQERLWSLEQGRALSPYRALVVVRVGGALDGGFLERAATGLVQRHEILRTRFERVPGLEMPLQVVEAARAEVESHDLSGLDAGERDEHCRALRAELVARPLDLEAGEPLRFTWLRLAEEEHLVLLALPALAADRASLALLVAELAASYAATAGGDGRPGDDGGQPLQYADVAEWLHELLDSEAGAEGRRYWQQLASAAGAASAPAEGFAPRLRPVPWPPDAGGRLEEVAAGLDCEPETVLLAVWCLLVRRLAGGAEPRLDVAFPGRNYEELADAVGLLSRYLPVVVPRAPRLGGLTARLAAVLDDHGEWQEYYRSGEPEEPAGRYGFAASRQPAAVKAAGLEWRVEHREAVCDRHTLELVAERWGAADWQLELLWDSAQLTDPEAAAVAARLAALLDRLLSAPATPLAGVEVLTGDETAWLAAVNGTAADLPGPRTLHDLVRAQAERTPRAVALTADGDAGSWTYGELWRRVETLAGHLRRRGVAPGVRVGLAVDRSPAMVLGMLGILEAGGAYVPLDPEYPRQRLEWMLEDSAAPVLVTTATFVDAFERPPGKVVLLDDDGPQREAADGEPPRTTAAATPDDAAYVIYTSGSTGRPKGVVMSHRAITNRLLWMQETFAFDAGDRLLQKTPYSFDASVWEIFVPLLSGGRLELAEPGGHRDAAYLLSEVAKRGVTVLQLVPSQLAVFLDQPGAAVGCAGLRRLFCGGEALPARLARRAARELGGDVGGCRVVNLYGPTEAAIDATWRPLGDDDPERGVLPIGRPLANISVQVVDGGLRRMPPGMEGELLIGGAGLARGYLGRPALTAERFVPDPSSATPGARLYRTGDLARWRGFDPADGGGEGELEFLGRADAQVKLRGVRIELGEVESVLASHPGVREAAASVREVAAGDLRLLAYAVLAPARSESESEPSPPRLVEFLASRLPAPMVPSEVVPLAELPRLPNGKLDRGALPAPEQARHGVAADYVAPSDSRQEILAALWADLLGVDRVGVRDDFFILGGHSLLATRMVARLRDAFRVELRVRDLFEASTIEALALRIAGAEAAAGADAGTVVPALRPAPPEGRLPLSFPQQRVWFLDRLEGGGGVYHLPAALRLAGPLKVPVLNLALDEIVRRHEVLRTRLPMVDGTPVQVIEPAAPLPLPRIDLSALGLGRRLEEATRVASRAAAAPFDLAAGPLLRALLLRLDEADHVLSFTLHHAVGDGVSSAVLVDELVSLYVAFREGRPSPLPALPLQYADYAVWQRDWLRGEVLEAQVDWWRGRLAGAPPLLDLPTDRPRPAEQTFRGDHLALHLPDPLTGELEALGRRRGVTLFMTLLTLFHTLMARYSGQWDASVGTPVANREHSELEPLIGFFANTLVLRTDLGGEPSLVEALGRVRETVLGAFAHQATPFEVLVDALQPQRDLSRTPLFQVMFSLQNAPEEKLALPGLEVTTFPLDSRTARFDVVLDAFRGRSGVRGSWQYNRDLFDRATAERMAAHFVRLATAAAAWPAEPLATLPLLDDGERRQLLVDWNDTAVDYPRRATLHGLVAARAARDPRAPALIVGGESLTYGELDRRADALARHLRGLGVAAEEPVGIHMERCADLVVALLGVLKAGGAYLPLDPDYPPQRVAFMLDDAGARWVLTRGDALPAGAEGGASAVDLATLDLTADAAAGPPPPISGADNLAYVIYTSGSTGRPKGVQVSHRNAVNFLAAMDPVAGAEHGTWLAVTSISFDISVLELFWTLSRGYRVVLHLQRGELVGAPAHSPAAAKAIDFSLFYFASSAGDSGRDSYRLLLEGAKFGDRHGFSAVWTPERHFHAFGGIYPNPSVTGAAVAAVTERLAVRAGSVVLPLHTPVRVAEEWSVVDNLSDGRVGISFASGWHADDFVLAPDNYEERKRIMVEGIETVRELWRGGSVRLPGGAGNEVEVSILPRPVQPELPYWVTAAGNPETFRIAGETGANLLTHLLGQTVDALAEKVEIYRRAWKAAGHAGEGHVSLMLHTFVGDDVETVRETVRGPFLGYLKSSLGLLRNLARSLGKDMSSEDFGEEDLKVLLDVAFDRYFDTAALLGTVDSCLPIVGRLRDAGVDEIACLIDFGVPTGTVLDSLPQLDALRRRANAAAGGEAESLPTLVRRHGVTHFQCTPSMARMLTSSPPVLEALSGLDALLVGGEALPTALADHLRERVRGAVHNMYGPTETTVWSATHRLGADPGPVPIGRPVANNRLYVVGPHDAPVPVGVAGELLIGGDGVVRGYRGRPALTADRFVPDPFGAAAGGGPGGRLYRTGDVARWLPSGELEFLGRLDHQVKVRGFRIESGEIETALEEHDEVAEAVVVARDDDDGGRRLVAYLVAAGDGLPDAAALRRHLRRTLPEYMLPALFVELPALPLTPNGKVDRKALPEPEEAGGPRTGAPYAAPRYGVERRLAEIWGSLLRLDRVGIHDNFFELGGDSILSVQAVARANEAGLGLAPRHLFQHQTIAELAPRVEFTGPRADAEQGPVTGTAPPTPIQRWLLDLGLEWPQHFNQSLLLATPRPLEAAPLAAALAHLLHHHDALRLRCEKIADGWRQRFTAPGGAPPLTTVDLSALPAARRGAAVRAAAAAAQTSLHLAAGPVVRFLHFTTGAAGWLFTAAHHLVVDGISWRLLVEDLETAYLQLAAGDPVALPRKTTSFRRWAEALAERAATAETAAQEGYWRSLLALPEARLPADDPRGENLERWEEKVSVHLGAAATGELLRRAPQVFRCGLDDVLLAALATAFARTHDRPSLLIDLEGHGRVDLGADLDPSRTVGWFAVLYPVLLEAAGDDLLATLKTVKERLRATPGEGEGYGLLRHGGEPSSLADLPAPEVAFNYLGRFDQLLADSRLFAPAALSHGPDHAPGNRRTHELLVNGFVGDDRLRVDFLFSRRRHRRRRVEELAAAFTEALERLVALAGEPGVAAYTPSDFPLAVVDQELLDELTAAGPVDDLYPLTPMQRGLLVQLQERAEDHQTYRFQLSCQVEGELDLDTFAEAWNRVVARHATLRTSFVTDLDRPLQVVRPDVRVEIRRLDWSGLEADEQGRRLEALLAADRGEDYDLSRAPLMRVTVAALGPARQQLVWSNHHLMLDGWSVPLVLRQVVESYEALRRGEELSLPPVPQVRDYVEWLGRQDREAAQDFWRRRLEGVTEPTPLGIDRPSVGAGAGFSEVEFELDADTTAALETLGRRHRLTLNTLVRGAWALLLARYAGRDDVLFGGVSSGRPADLPGVERMVGVFVQTLPVRLRVAPDRQLLPWLTNLQREQIEALEHEHLPLVEMQAMTGVPAGTPLFESLQVFENYPMEALDEPGATSIRLRRILPRIRADFPLVAVAVPGHRLSFHVAFDRGRFAAPAVERMGRHLANLLRAVEADPDRRLGALPLLGDEERRQLLFTWNDTARPLPDGTFLDLFDERVEAIPDAVAVEGSDGALTYDELAAEAKSLAARLRRLGVGPEVTVGVALERSPQLVVAFLAILRAGGAFLPLDPSYPLDRLRWMVEDSGTPAVVTAGEPAEVFAGLADLDLRLVDPAGDAEADEDAATPAAPPLPENLAYVIYTSGSTGRPKGVGLRHRGLLNLALALPEAFAIDAESRLLHFASPSFDATVAEIFPTLAAGGTLVTARREELMPGPDLLRLLVERRVTDVILPPSALATLGAAAADELDALRNLVVAGEACPAETVETWAPGRRFVDAYGPTEMTVCASRQVCAAGEGKPSIGTPIPNTRAYVVDHHGRPVPPGVPGELWLGGEGIARGYLGRPALTAAAFVPDPFGDEPGRRLYRTGDLARHLEDGRLDFLGRIDHQVKVRGFRVEPGEVEAVLSALDGIREAVVVARRRGAGDARLAAYLLLDEGTPRPAPAALREALGATLPSYMVPSHFVILDDIPRTGSGKVDRRSLPDLERVAGEGARRAPRTPGEEMVAAVAARVLGLEEVDAGDSFLDLGGHSLLAAQMVSRLRRVFGVELPLRSLFEAPSLARLAAQVEELSRRRHGVEIPPLEPVPRDGALPLSFAQRRIWFLERLGLVGPSYHIPAAVRIDGPVDAGRLRRALEMVVERHESLRTAFPEENPVQEILDARPLPFAEIDLGGTAAEESEALRLAGELVRRPFRLDRDPLLRAWLLRLAADDHLLVLNVHHVVSDGWSAGVLVSELGELYAAVGEGRPPSLPELPVQYADYAVWQRSWLDGDLLAAELEHWRRTLSGAPPLLDLPTDRPRPAAVGFEGGTVSRHVDADLRAGAGALARELGATPFMVLLSAFQTVLARWSRQHDVSVGTPVAGRNRLETENLIGFLVNTLVLRTDLSGAPSFAELVRRVREVTLEAQAHGEVPFEMLVEELEPERDLSRTPLFQVMFALQNAPLGKLDLPGVTLRPAELHTGTAKFDLTLEVVELSDGLRLVAEYRRDLFDASTVRRLLAAYETLLRAAVEDPGTAIADLPLLPEEDRRLVAAWTRREGPGTPAGRAATPVERFVARAAERPDAVALTCGDETWTYGRLDTESNRLARQLRRLGVGPEVRVGLALDRTPRLVLAILAVLKAGGAYVPLDPTYPEERLSFLIVDCGAPVVLSEEAHAERVAAGGAEVVCLDGDGAPACGDGGPLPLSTPAGCTAYVIYTSGSTGRPKGVPVSHAAVARLFDATDHWFGFGPDDVWTLFHSYAFDFSVWELWGALAHGGRLVVVPYLTSRSPEDFRRLLVDEGVTVLNQTPSAFRQLVAVDAAAADPEDEDLALRWVIFGGEALELQSLRPWFRRHGAGGPRLVNMYGITETTVHVTYREITLEDLDAAPGSVIGTPIPDLSVQVLDPRGRPVSPGVPGELHVGGPGLSRGYLGRPALTATRFVPDPRAEHPGERLYCTGDLGRWLAGGGEAGDLEYLGRVDHQVQLRGFRVELGEIEAALAAHAEVGETVVVLRQDEPGPPRLVAYVVAASGAGAAPGAGALRGHLQKLLPEYMVPAAYVVLDALPLTPHGKVDRRALPAAGGDRPDLEGGYVAPEGVLEQMLAELWSEVLGVERVGAEDNFFALGGDSMRTLQVLTNARERGLDFELQALYRHQTVRELAAALAGDLGLDAGAPRDGGDEDLEAMLEELEGMSDDEVRALLQEAARGGGGEGEG